MPPLQIETAMLQHTHASLNTHKEQGPDSLHPAVLKAIPPLVGQPLTELLNLSLASAEVPDDCMSAIARPIYNKVDRGDPGNYCPLSLTSIVCKLIETTLKGTILNHLQQTAALFAAQYGFIPHRFCLSNPLAAQERITRLLDSNE